MKETEKENEIGKKAHKDEGILNEKEIKVRKKDKLERTKR